jgi:hypothetical protein
MGNFANGRILNTLAALGYMLILAIAFNYLRQIVASG